jgi:hypothetical protein
MDVLSLCTVESIEIAIAETRDGVKARRVTAHRYLDWAVHRVDTADLFKSRWCLTHLPSGRRGADDFSSLEGAVGAMVEIARLRNDWFCIEDGATTAEVGRKVEEIIKRHDPRARLANGRKGGAIKNVLNGYSGAQA